MIITWQLLFSGSVMSPEIQDGTQARSQDPFYMLKKDSQRRSDLNRVLKEDANIIATQWHESFLRVRPETAITEVLQAHKSISYAFGTICVSQLTIYALYRLLSIAYSSIASLLLPIYRNIC